MITDITLEEFKINMVLLGGALNETLVRPGFYEWYLPYNMRVTATTFGMTIITTFTDPDVEEVESFSAGLDHITEELTKLSENK